MGITGAKSLRWSRLQTRSRIESNGAWTLDRHGHQRHEAGQRRPVMQYQDRQSDTGSAMISQCANPACRRKLHYLRNGKMYLFEVSTKTGGKRTEHFWLCGECSKSMILTCVNQSDVKAVRQDAGLRKSDSVAG